VDNAQKGKIDKHAIDCLNAGYEFSPVAFDVCGLLSESADNLIVRAASAASLRNGYPKSYQLSLFRRHISLAIQIGLASQLDVLHSCTT
jgi:hypothetical protein